MNRELAMCLLFCQNKGLLETMVQKKVAWVKVLNELLPSALYCFKDGTTIDNKYGQQEEYCGFTRILRKRVAIRCMFTTKYVDKRDQKLTPKEVF
ncbi:hypothetical protein HPG69_001900 [Diceros bicornis minor]|uniref:Uncharacterized protein n=1 Tax=Diceros bicornis minor TaxID=77932 RepID=A0A7J7FCK2_DICBM|nr:hypothetical protein HPG69_001900 [Diceros bicornis minor]